MPKKICRDCKKEFEAKSAYSTKYAQKYCEKCAKERREAYADIHNVTAGDCEDE
jgi:hypothetical protein